MSDHDPIYDAVIVGGSFAGLAVAQQLRGYRVLIVDQRPIGTHRTSTCAVPLTTARLVAAEGATLETHDALVLHTGGATLRYPLREPFVTFDYHAFCQAMLARTAAEVLIAKATGAAGDTVQTSTGPVRGRFLVDASGWQALQRQPTDKLRAERMIGYGTETELHVRLADRPGIHFYFDKGIVRRGYAWVFPCGATTRIGVCSFDPGVPLGPLLDTFLAQFGLHKGTTHGGAMPVRRRPHIVGDVFVVGDAAGQCLPVTAEGIRAAIYHGRNAGQAIAASLADTIPPAAARARYAAQARRTRRFQAALFGLQSVVARVPDRWIAALARAYTFPAINHYVVGKYLRASGWPT